MTITEKSLLAQLVARLDRADRNLQRHDAQVANLDVLVVRNYLLDLIQEASDNDDP